MKKKYYFILFASTLVGLVLLAVYHNLFVIFFHFNECDGYGKENELRVAYHTNGVFESMQKVKGCLTDGFKYEYYDNGVIKSIKYYKNYYPDSTIQLRHGKWKDFSNNGILFRERLFEEGKLINTTLYDTLSITTLDVILSNE